VTVDVTNTPAGGAVSSDPVGLAPLPPGAEAFPGQKAPVGLVSLSVGEGGKRSRRGSLALRLAAPVSIFVAWWILTVTNVIEPTTLSTPGATWDAFVQLLLHQDLIGDVGVSIRRALLGLALGAGVGLILGIIVGLYRLGEELLDSSLQMLRTVPYPALIFLFIVWFGVGEAEKIFLVSLGVSFPIYINTTLGIRQVDPKLLELGRVQGLGNWQLIHRIILPGALPSILTGVRYSLATAWLALVVAETIGAQSGLGFLAMESAATPISA